MCGCSDDRFSSFADCQAQIADAFDAEIAAGAKVDEACFDQTLASDSLNGCTAWVWEPEDWGCPALVHSKPEGAPCSLPTGLRPMRVAMCGPGLVCSQGVCTPDTGEPIPPKAYAAGDPCTPSDGCGGMYCGYDHRCHERGGSGASCDHPHGCDGALYCQGLGEGLANGSQGICVEWNQPGDPCDPRDWVPCASPNWPDEAYACDPSENRCAPDQPGICRQTHPLIARQ